MPSAHLVPSLSDDEDLGFIEQLCDSSYHADLMPALYPAGSFPDTSQADATPIIWQFDNGLNLPILSVNQPWSLTSNWPNDEANAATKPSLQLDSHPMPLSDAPASTAIDS
ncbi:hypothetical protein H4R34_005821, partial [Dimargaris verticillata]